MASKRRQSMKQLLVQAKKLKKPDPYVTSEEFGPVIDTLREKGLSWKEINAWCAERGYKWSVGGMTSGWRVWSRKRKKR